MMDTTIGRTVFSTHAVRTTNQTDRDQISRTENIGRYRRLKNREAIGKVLITTTINEALHTYLDLLHLTCSCRRQELLLHNLLATQTEQCCPILAMEATILWETVLPRITMYHLLVTEDGEKRQGRFSKRLR